VARKATRADLPARDPELSVPESVDYDPAVARRLSTLPASARSTQSPIPARPQKVMHAGSGPSGMLSLTKCGGPWTSG